MKVAAIILHSFAVFMCGWLGAIWFSNSGYAGMAWLGFAVGGFGYVGAVCVLAVLWLIVIESEMMKGESK